MNLYKTMALGIGFLVAPSLYSQVAQFDNEGKKIGLELIKVYMEFAKTTKTPPLNFNFEQWNPLLQIYVKTYVEDNSKSLGIQDRELTRNLNLLLQMNNTLMKTIKEVQGYKKPVRPLNETDLHLLSERLLKPLEQIEQSTKNTIMPALEKQSYWVSADTKNRAKAMLIHTFDLLRHIAADTMKYAAAMIYMN